MNGVCHGFPRLTFLKIIFDAEQFRDRFRPAALEFRGWFRNQIPRIRERRRAAALQDAGAGLEWQRVSRSVLECASPLALWNSSGTGREFEGATSVATVPPRRESAVLQHRFRKACNPRNPRSTVGPFKRFFRRNPSSLSLRSACPPRVGLFLRQQTIWFVIGLGCRCDQTSP